ncbi:MAG: hypothetical protein KAQ95_13025, partial [Candidatus Heimdallarchaeota archaeon]|nr:hypothetical protein [Candidatus Heimdallarchaeota archaeon]
RWRAVLTGSAENTARMFSLNILYEHEPKPPARVGLIIGLLFVGLLIATVIVVAVLIYLKKIKIPTR